MSTSINFAGQTVNIDRIREVTPVTPGVETRRTALDYTLASFRFDIVFVSGDRLTKIISAWEVYRDEYELTDEDLEKSSLDGLPTLSELLPEDVAYFNEKAESMVRRIQKFMQKLVIERDRKRQETISDMVARSEHDRLEARADGLLAAMRKIAMQQTCREQEEDPDRESDSTGSKLGDIEGGYDSIIEIARMAVVEYGDGEYKNKNEAI